MPSSAPAGPAFARVNEVAAASRAVIAKIGFICFVLSCVSSIRGCPSSALRNTGASLGGQVGPEERGQRVEGNEVDPVVQVDVPGPGNEHQLLGFGGEPIGVLAELARMSLVT